MDHPLEMTEAKQHCDGFDFLAGGGEMGALIRDFDWDSTPLGSPDTWPQSLRLSIRLMLNSQHPMFIWWGEDLIQFYNDGYRQTMGPEMHPSALGGRGRESWANIWHIIGPQIEYVLAGKGATWNEDQMVPINRHGGLQEVWWTYGYSPIDLDGEVGGVLVVCKDVTEQHLLTERLRDRGKRLAKQFESAPGFIAVLNGRDHVFEMTNATYRQMIGNRDVIGKPVREALPETEAQGFIQLLDEVYATGEYHIGRRTRVSLQGDNPETTRDLFLDFVFQPIIEADGKVSGIFVQGQDVTEHVQAEENLALLNRELQHRVKNILAMVSAVANQTLRDETGPEALAAYQARLSAFGAAQDALGNGTISESQLDRIVTLALKPHIPKPNRFVIEGPGVPVGSKQAVAISLALHELATNATKFGALSNETGKVNLEWSAELGKDGTFRLQWLESGGPDVTPPARAGFGSRLLQTALAAELGGEVELNYWPTGFELTVSTTTGALLSRYDN